MGADQGERLSGGLRTDLKGMGDHPFFDVGKRDLFDEERRKLFFCDLVREMSKFLVGD
jgi:hypothetical protein